MSTCIGSAVKPYFSLGSKTGDSDGLGGAADAPGRRNHSTVAFTDSSQSAVGSHPRSSRAFAMLAHVRRTSPDRLGAPVGSIHRPTAAETALRTSLTERDF